MRQGIAPYPVRHRRQVRPPPLHRADLDLWIVGEFVYDCFTTTLNSSSRSRTYLYSDIERTPSRSDTARIVAAPCPPRPPALAWS